MKEVLKHGGLQYVHLAVVLCVLSDRNGSNSVHNMLINGSCCLPESNQLTDCIHECVIRRTANTALPVTKLIHLLVFS